MLPPNHVIADFKLEHNRLPLDDFNLAPASNRSQRIQQWIATILVRRTVEHPDSSAVPLNMTSFRVSLHGVYAAMIVLIHDTTGTSGTSQSQHVVSHVENSCKLYLKRPAAASDACNGSK